MFDEGAGCVNDWLDDAKKSFDGSKSPATGADGWAPAKSFGPAKELPGLVTALLGPNGSKSSAPKPLETAVAVAAAAAGREKAAEAGNGAACFGGAA